MPNSAKRNLGKKDKGQNSNERVKINFSKLKIKEVRLKRQIER
jgi:hypothetical protein